MSMWQEVINLENYRLNFNNYYAISGLYNAFFAFLFSTFIYAKNRRNLTNISYGIFGFFVGVWCFSYFLWQISITEKTALFWSRGLMAGAMFITIAYYHFIVSYLNLIQKKKNSIIVGYLIFSVFFVFNFTSLFVPEVRPILGFRFWPKAGVLFAPFLVFWFFYALYALYLLLRMYRTSSGNAKNQARFILIGMFFAYAGGSTNYLPWYGIEIMPIGNYFCVLAYMSLTGYAIIKYKALEIDTVIHRTILWIGSSILLASPGYFLIKLLLPWLKTLNALWVTIFSMVLFHVYLVFFRHFQPKVDHLFRRRKYDYQTLLGKIAEKISTTISIEDLTKQLLNEICEAMYLRNAVFYVLDDDGSRYHLLGRRGNDQVDGAIQINTLEIFTAQEREALPLAQREISCQNNSLCSWIAEHRDVIEREQVEADPQYESIKQQVLTCFNDHNIELIVPVVVNDQVNAILGLGKKENLQSYTVKDLELLKKLGQEAGVTVFNALHYKDLAEKERLDEEMKMGRQIQVNLLPAEIPLTEGIKLRGMMFPAKEIGGDYYDFVDLPSDNVGIVIGDVSGKGVAAGLLMAMAKTAIHSFSGSSLSPKEVLLRTNAILQKSTKGQKFMTMLYLQWNAPERKLTYSSAGHEHILVFHADSGKVEAIMSGGFMLGMIPDIAGFLEDRQISLKSKDKVVLYTDGVTEARDPQENLYGLEKLIQAVEKHGLKPADELIAAIKDEVYAFIGTREQYDDITLVVMEAT